MRLQNIHNNNRDISLFCRKEDGNLEIIKDSNFFPYFFEPHPEGTFRSYPDNRPLKKVFCSFPYEVPKLRSKDSYSSDVLFCRRYMIDKINVIEKSPTKYCFLDIEVLVEDEFPNPNQSRYPISCITLYNSLSKSIQSWFLLDYKGTIKEQETQLLKDFIAYMKKEAFDVIFSWNISFDYNYLYNRIPEFPKLISFINENRYGKQGILYPAGTSIVDYLSLFRIIKKGIKSYALDYVCQELLGEEPFKKIEFGKLTPDIKEKNINDIKRMVRLEEKFKIIEHFDEVRRNNKVCWEDLLFNSRAIEARAFEVAKKLNVILPNKKRDEEIENSEFEGAYREAFKTGAFWQGSSYDLSGAYLFTIVDLCLDSANIVDAPSENTIKVEVKNRETQEVENTYYVKQDPQALLPSIARNLIEEKQKYKDLKNNTDPNLPEYKTIEQVYEAVKSLVLSAWGVIGNKYFRLFDVRVASMITGMVRDLLHYVKEELAKLGYDLIYLDTDGIIVLDKGKDISELLNELIQQWAQEKFGKKSSITFDYEGTWEKLFIVALCHYKGWKRTPKGKLKEEIKGLEVKRISSTDYEGKFQDELLEKIMNKESREQAIEFIKQEIKTLPEKPIEEIAFPAKLAKPISEYKTFLIRKSKDKETGEIVEKRFDKKLPIHIRAVQNSKLDKKVGQLYFWVYSTGEHDVLAFDETKKLDTNLIDWQMAIKRNILNKVEAIFKAQGWDMGDLVPEKPKKERKPRKKGSKKTLSKPKTGENKEKVSTDTPKIEEKKEKTTEVIENTTLKPFYEE